MDKKRWRYSPLIGLIIFIGLSIFLFSTSSFFPRSQSTNTLTPTPMEEQKKPKSFAEALPLALKAYQKHNTPEAQKKWQEDVYAHRWKNFGWSTLFVLVSAGFLWFGKLEQERFYSPIHWYIFMGLASIFLLVGMWTWITYLKLILR